MLLMFFDYFSPIFIAMMPDIVFVTLMMPPRRLITDAFTSFHADLPVFLHEDFFASRRRRFAMMPLFAHHRFSPAIFFSMISS
jgi:hypothetical protein